jgi:Rv0078B-related antitoxin
VEPIRDRLVRARFEAALDLYESAEQMVLLRLRREHPDAGDEEIKRLLVVEWLHGSPGLDQEGGLGNRVFRPRRPA